MNISRVRPVVTLLAGVAALLAAFPLFAGEAVTLKVGDPAPQLQVASWVKGGAVAKLEKGTIYVIECWATWCGPCRVSIPHLSELNARFQDKGVVIVGVDVLEPDTAGVAPFVEKMGDRMSYRVALDAPDEKDPRAGKTAQAWMRASGQPGIPCAFVVDKQGALAWIGHPMDGLDTVLEALVDGTFDARKHAEREAKRKDVEKRIQAAARTGDADRLLALADEMIELDPANVRRVGAMKFSLLLTEKHDAKAAYALAATLAEGGLKDDAQSLNSIAFTILDAPGVEKRDLDLAMRLAVRADALTKHDNAAILDTLARAHFEKGQIEKAVEVQTLAVQKAEDDEMKKELTATLERFKAKQGK